MKAILFSLALIICFPAIGLAKDHEPYLSIDELPNGINYLPAPPSTDSQRFFYDWSQYMWGKSLRDTPRGEMARQDAVCDAYRFAKIYSEVIDFEISEANTPFLFLLILL